MKHLVFILFMLVFGAAYSQQQCVNFSFDQYKEFLLKLKSNEKIVVVTQAEFHNYYDTTKIIVSLRHDIDVSIYNAIQMAKVEKMVGIKSTYFFLHTADYYIKDGDYSQHNDSILPKLLYLQELGHEVGLHNDLLTLQVAYGISPTQWLSKELSWLRSNGLKIVGTASHGSPYCRKYKYLNYYFFKDCRVLYSENMPNIDTVWKNGVPIVLEKAWLSDFGFEYESYLLDYNKYISEAASYNPETGEYFNPTLVDISEWRPGDRIVILTHPVHWHNPGRDGLTLYPNPARNMIHLSIDDIFDNQELEVEIYDLTGKKVFSKKTLYSAGGLTLYFNLVQGFYLIRAKYQSAKNGRFKDVTQRMVVR